MLRCPRRAQLPRGRDASSRPASSVLLFLPPLLVSSSCRFDFPFPQVAAGEDAAPRRDADLVEDAEVRLDAIGADADPAGDGGPDQKDASEDAFVAVDGAIPIDPPISLEITSQAQRVRAGDCSSPVVLEAWDASGRPSGVVSPTVIDLTAQSDSRFTFYSDAGCRSQTTRVEIPTGGTTVQFRFRATLAGAANVVVSAVGLGPDIQTQIIDGGAAFSLSFATPPRIATRSECSEPVMIQALDQFGNTTVVSSTTAVFLSANPAAGFDFFSGPGCGVLVSMVPIPRQRGSVAFHFVGSRAWDVTVTASGLGAPVAQRQSICEADCSVCGGNCCLEHCGSADCTLSCGQASCPCVFDCDEGSDDCEAVCSNGSRCSIDCAGSRACIVTCEQSSSCVIGCEGSSDCRSIACDGGADCLLRCGANPECQFSSCDNGTGTSTCGGGVLVCNRPCP